MKGKAYVAIFFVLLLLLIVGFYTFSISFGAIRVDASFSDNENIGLSFTHSRDNDLKKGDTGCISVSGSIVHDIIPCNMDRDAFAQSIIDNVAPGEGKCGFVNPNDKSWYCNNNPCFDYGGYTFDDRCVSGSLKNYCKSLQEKYCNDMGLGYTETRCQASFDLLKNYVLSETSYFRVNGNNLKNLIFSVGEGNPEVCAVSDSDIYRPLNVEVNLNFKKPEVCPTIAGYKIENSQCIQANGCDVVYNNLEDCEKNLQPNICNWQCKFTEFLVSNIGYILVGLIIVGVVVFLIVK